MNAKFHQFTPEELYVGMVEPNTLEADVEYDLTENGFRATGCRFLDAFLGNLHQYGCQTAKFHASLLGVEYTDFCFTIITLTGMKFTDFTTRYVLLMANDVLKDKKKSMPEKAKALGFGSYSGMYRFLIRNKVRVKKSRRIYD